MRTFYLVVPGIFVLSALVGCASTRQHAFNVAAQLDHYNHGTLVVVPNLPARPMFPDRQRSHDSLVRTMSFQDGNGSGYFQTTFKRLTGADGVGDAASVTVTKAYCANAPQVTMGFSSFATAEPYCSPRTDLPFKVSDPQQIDLAAGKIRNSRTVLLATNRPPIQGVGPAAD